MQELKTIGAFLLIVTLVPIAIVGRLFLEVVRMLHFGILFVFAAIWTLADLCMDIFEGVKR